MVAKQLEKKTTGILIVDDNLQYARVLVTMLREGLGFEQVMHVEHPDKAYQMIEESPERFTLLFVDYHLGDGQTGGALLRKLQEHALLEDKAAFLITAEPSIENLREATAAGALGVVAKPFDRRQLKLQIEKAEASMHALGVEYF